MDTYDRANVGPDTEPFSNERIRRDPVTGRLVVVAPERGTRPGASKGGSLASAPPRCPFCPGHESDTPPEVDAVRDGNSLPNGPGWLVRVVPNKFAAIPGGHEVIIHSPHHDRDLESLTVPEVAAVLEMYARRMDVHLGAGARAVTTIHNSGAHAGASLEHPHSQVFALPIVPPGLAEELANVDRHHSRYGECLICSEMRAARGAGRIVFEGPLTAWVPYAARWPYEVWLAPERHAPRFAASSAVETAAVLQQVLRAIDAATGGAPRNFWLHTMPAELHSTYHWHLEFAPRTAIAAGFEFSSGMTISEMEPRCAAEELRATLEPA